MKRIIILIGLFIVNILFITDVYADDNIITNEPIIQFNSINKYSLQGYSIVKDKLFMVLEGYDDTKSIIKVFNLNTNKEIISYNYGSLGHANDVTYNDITNKIYIIAGGGSDKVFIFNGDTFKYEKTINIGLPVRSITYIKELNRYAVRTVGVGFWLDKDFKQLSKFPFIIGMNYKTDIGRQGWTYYKDLIYYANWSWKRLGGDGANIVYVYDLDGNKIANLYTTNDIGELEGIDFYKDKMILGFNGYDKTIKFYKTDIPKFDRILVEEEIVVETKGNDDLNLIPICMGIIFVIIGGTILILIKKKNSY